MVGIEILIHGEEARELAHETGYIVWESVSHINAHQKASSTQKILNNQNKEWLVQELSAIFFFLSQLWEHSGPMDRVIWRQNTGFAWAQQAWLPVTKTDVFIATADWIVSNRYWSSTLRMLLKLEETKLSHFGKLIKLDPFYPREEASCSYGDQYIFQILLLTTHRSLASTITMCSQYLIYCYLTWHYLRLRDSPFDKGCVTLDT